MFYLLRWLFFSVRLVLHYGLGLLRFFSKPGSRVLVPLAFAAWGIMTRPAWHEALSHLLRRQGFAAGWLILDGLGLLALVAGWWIYSLLSMALNIVIGAFPMPMRPLSPQRRLKPTKTNIKPAVVRVVVPRLPRR